MAGAWKISKPYANQESPAQEAGFPAHHGFHTSFGWWSLHGNVIFTAFWKESFEQPTNSFTGSTERKTSPYLPGKKLWGDVYRILLDERETPVFPKCKSNQETAIMEIATSKEIKKMYNECFHPCSVWLNKTPLVFMLEIGKGRPCQHTDKFQNCFCSQENHWHLKNPIIPKCLKGKNGTCSQTCKHLLLLFHWWLWLFMDGSSSASAVVKVVPSHLSLKRNIFYSMLTFCMEIIQHNYSNPSQIKHIGLLIFLF